MSKKNNRHIFKLQRAVVGDDFCLIYNENRSIMGQFKTTPAEQAILKGELKTYFLGTYDEKTTKYGYIRHLTKEELKKVDW